MALIKFKSIFSTQILIRICWDLLDSQVQFDLHRYYAFWHDEFECFLLAIFELNFFERLWRPFVEFPVEKNQWYGSIFDDIYGGLVAVYQELGAHEQLHLMPLKNRLLMKVEEGFELVILTLPFEGTYLWKTLVGHDRCCQLWSIIFFEWNEYCSIILMVTFVKSIVDPKACRAVGWAAYFILSINNESLLACCWRLMDERQRAFLNDGTTNLIIALNLNDENANFTFELLKFEFMSYNLVLGYILEKIFFEDAEAWLQAIEVDWSVQRLFVLPVVSTCVEFENLYQ